MATAVTHPSPLTVESTPLLVDATAAAVLCGKHLRTWRAWQAAGRIPRPIRIGRSLMWRYCRPGERKACDSSWQLRFPCRIIRAACMEHGNTFRIDRAWRR